MEKYRSCIAAWQAWLVNPWPLERLGAPWPSCNRPLVPSPSGNASLTWHAAEANFFGVVVSRVSARERELDIQCSRRCKVALKMLGVERDVDNTGPVPVQGRWGGGRNICVGRHAVTCRGPRGQIRVPHRVDASPAKNLHRQHGDDHHQRK